jgi:hypothetical protein
MRESLKSFAASVWFRLLDDTKPLSYGLGWTASGVENWPK